MELKNVVMLYDNDVNYEGAEPINIENLKKPFIQLSELAKKQGFEFYISNYKSYNNKKVDVSLFF